MSEYDSEIPRQPSPPRRRRRRRRRPKWQRVLHKYWPPIRFGLLICAAVLVLFVGGRAIVNGFRLAQAGGGGQLQTENTLPSESTAPTLSQEEIRAQVDALLAQAEFTAAGYDYEKAIQMLEACPDQADFPEIAEKIAEYQQLDSQLVPYGEMNNITHIFFHSLIVDPSRAFDGEYTQDGYQEYMATVDEFNKIMEEMYRRGFVLVSPYDVAYEVTDETGTHFTYGSLRLPEGKIPFILSQDDVNYYGYMIGGADGSAKIPIYPNTKGDGFAHKLVIGEDGYPTCEYMDENGNITTGDYDLVPLLESFIQKHPDFSYHGARAVLGITGYEGVLGYRTKPSYEETIGTEAYQKEVTEAKAVVQCLKDHGWILASHSYGHPAYGEITAEKAEQDSDKWEDTVQPIIGDTDIFIYPYGSDIAGIEKYTFDNAKFKALYEDGYRYFFNVDGHYAWCQMGTDYFRGGRRNIDGYRMKNNPDMLEDLFDVASVYDPARPVPFP